jgi:hypothetical protein
MRVLVCGGRDYSDRMAVWHTLDAFAPAITEVISGMARGADTFAAEWARRFLFPLHEFPANWKRDGRAAGSIRNQRMLTEGRPDAVIAFPGGRGTADMVRRSEKAGLPVYRVGW